MTMPQPVNAGFGPEYGPPVVVVHEWAPGVEVVQDVGPGFNAPGVNVVSEYAPGVRPVYFANGLPPHLDPSSHIRQQEQYAAAVQAARQGVHESQLAANRALVEATNQAAWLLTIL
jgi:hypothetical protein